MAKASRNERRKRRHQRVRRNVMGMPNKPRLNVFRSLKNIYAQVIDDLKGETLVAASSLDEQIKSKSGDLTKTEQARLVGELVAERASEAGVKQVVFDRGGYKYHGRVQALAEGAREGGLEF
jgi:large subunit ribosomal protein L18